MDSWEHIALSEWLDAHSLPGDEALEEEKQALFEEECRYWEEVAYRPLHSRSIWDSSELTDFEDSAFFDLRDCLED